MSLLTLNEQHMRVAGLMSIIIVVRTVRLLRRRANARDVSYTSNLLGKNNTISIFVKKIHLLQGRVT